MNPRDPKALQTGALQTPTDLGSNAVRDIAGALSILLAENVSKTSSKIINNKSRPRPLVRLLPIDAHMFVPSLRHKGCTGLAQGAGARERTYAAAKRIWEAA